MNLAKISLAERSKTPHARANEEVVAEMRVFQQQLKVMRKCLVYERLRERELEAGRDA
jgi:hypothetical protein